MFNRILILQHKGGEYISVNISGIGKNRDEIWETLNRAGKELRKPSVTGNVALQILDSRLTKEETGRITLWLFEMRSNIDRLAIIGARWSEKRLFNKSLKKYRPVEKGELSLNKKYIFDWDTAKDWLVGRRSEWN